MLKVICEPSSSINMISVVKWLKTQTTPKKLLVLISGGNTNPGQLHEISDLKICHAKKLIFELITQ
ncbi:MAG: hypothetical protein ACRYE8_02010 [Janthinobacterium lividum]